MQVSAQNRNQIPPQIQYNSSYNCSACNPTVSCQPQQTPVSYVQNPNPASYPVNNPQYYYPQPQYIQQPQYTQQPQSLQVPSTASGVNIQIFNPSVATPGAMGPTYNVNAPSYPSGYYTGQYGPCPCCQNGGNSSSSSSKTTETEFTNSNDKKTKKSRVVLLTDEYIKNLENYLNSQDKSVRLNAAKEVFNRLDEDPARKNDKALTALINKMLQDPNQEIRIIALSALEGRIVNGDDFTVQVLQNMQTNPQGQGFDATDASRILLDMSARRVDKEVEIDPDKRTKIKTEKTEEKKEKSQIKK